MTDANGVARPDPVFFPDIAAATSLHIALQREFDALGHRLTAHPEHVPDWRYVGARVDDSGRSTSVLLGVERRVFALEFFDGRVNLARGTTSDLRAAAGAINTWHRGVRVRALRSEWSFVHVDALAEAHERGEAAEYLWRQFHENRLNLPQLVPLRSFIAAAIREPRLRALYPHTDLAAMGFSRTPGYPYSGGCPRVIPLDDSRYLVSSADGAELHVADARGCVAVILAALDL